MPIYNPKSPKAEEFINDGEIRATLEYAEANKNNVELIDEILEKARPKKTESCCVCAGLTHREASVLLACEIPEKIEKIYEIAEEIKLAFYGNRIVIFAPLYLSNYCETAAFTARTTLRISILHVKNSLRRRCVQRLSLFRIWDISALQLKQVKTL